jgi:uncharacterized delta-60 repeat protein
VAEITAPEKGVAINTLASSGEGKVVGGLSGRLNRLSESADVYFGAFRLNQDGSLDTTFGEGGFSVPFSAPPVDPPFGEVETQATGLAVQSDGKVVEVGYRYEYREVDPNIPDGETPVLLRYGVDGRRDEAFGNRGVVMPTVPNGRHLSSVAIQPSGRIIVAGTNEFAPLVLAYDSSGQIDRSFGEHGKFTFPSSVGIGGSEFTSVRVLASNKILLAGVKRGRPFLARLTAEGRLDRSFGGGDGSVFLKRSFCCETEGPPAVQRNGGILMQWWVTHGVTGSLVMARLSPDGDVDRSFGQGGLIHIASNVNRKYSQGAVAVQKDGRFVVLAVTPAGTQYGSRAMYKVKASRYLSSGKRDASFGSGGIQTETSVGPAGAALLTDRDGRVVATTGATGPDDVLGRKLRLTRYSAPLAR